MQLRSLREGRRLLVCSLLWWTVRGADDHDVRLAQRQTPGTYIEPVTSTVTVFTQFTVTETVTVTVTPTKIIPTTVMSTECTTTTAVTTETTSAEVDNKRRRQAGAGRLTTTSTTTVWRFPDATETLTVTATDLQSAQKVTTTQVVTEVTVVTAKETVVASSLSSSSFLAETTADRPDPLGVTNPNATKEEAGGVHLAIVLSAVFGGLIGAVAIFVTGFLWAKKRQEKLLELEEVAGSAPPGGGGEGRVAGLLGSVLGSTRSSTHYSTIPDAAMFLAASRQLPPQLPPVDLDPPSDYSFDVHYGGVPQLPTLHIPPSRQSFAYDYTFGSPVSSISEGFTQTSAGREMANRANWPPPPATVGRGRGQSLTSEEEVSLP